MDKKELSICLSKLKTLNTHNINLEQYQSEGELVSDILWKAYMNSDIKNRTIGDIGCGNGIFGLGALLLGAKKVYFIDIDKQVIKVAKENSKCLNLKKALFINKDIKEFDKKVDVILMNPPFGVQKKHNDKVFLEKAFKISNVIYSLHKIESKRFIENLSQKNNFKVIKVYPYSLLIKQTYKFHKKRTHYVKVGCWHLQRKL